MTLIRQEDKSKVFVEEGFIFNEKLVVARRKALLHYLVKNN